MHFQSWSQKSSPTRLRFSGERANFGSAIRLIQLPAFSMTWIFADRSVFVSCVNFSWKVLKVNLFLTSAQNYFDQCLSQVLCEWLDQTKKRTKITRWFVDRVSQPSELWVVTVSENNSATTQKNKCFILKPMINVADNYLFLCAQHACMQKHNYPLDLSFHMIWTLNSNAGITSIKLRRHTFQTVSS